MCEDLQQVLIARIEANSFDTERSIHAQAVNRRRL
jgi:hypothetical protein